MLVAAAVCPHPPLLVPDVAAGASGELEQLRAACDRAVRGLLDTEPDLLVVVGDAPATRRYPLGTRGSLREFGVDVEVGPGDGPTDLPLAHTVGRWLLDRAGYPEPALHVGVARDADASLCRTMGAELVAAEPRVGLLVMGDGSARRDERAPGYVDPRAVPFDDEVAGAFAAGRVEALAGLDQRLADELWVAGRASWQVLAGAVGANPVEADLIAYTAPYGVAYFVTAWRVA